MENHGIVTMQHDMVVNGHHMVNRKQKIVFTTDEPKKTTMIHFRSIDDYSCIVKETFIEGIAEPERHVETDMTEDQQKEFEEHWTNLWHPQTTVDVNVSLIS